MRLSGIEVELDLSFLKVKGQWEPNEHERLASWELYVELITRISIAELKPNEGLLREALSSLHSLFDVTRQLLRQHGPIVAQPQRKGDLCFGALAIIVLNQELRPVLSYWHPLLLDHEATRKKNVSAFEHEQHWTHSAELREALNKVRGALIAYANLLAKAANVPSLITE